MAIVLRMKEFIGCANTSDSFGVYIETLFLGKVNYSLHVVRIRM